MHRRLFLGLLAIVLAGQVACVDINQSSTGGNAALYLHNVEGGVARIQVITDLEGAFSGTGTPALAKTITSSVLSKAVPLAWGGLALDPDGNVLYIVGETGTVIRISRLRSQSSGEILNTSSDIAYFTLGSSNERLAGGKFGQAAFYSNKLFVLEANDSGDTQIWAVSSPAAIATATTVPLATLGLTLGDKFGSGFAAGGGSVYGYFKEGNNLDITDSWTGPRLRKGSVSAFPFLGGAGLGGDKTLVGKYGSLALDISGSNLLYCARHNEAAGTTGSPIQVFSVGQFTSGGANQNPTRLMGTTDMNNLRVLAHAGNRDWLAALTSNGDVAVNVFWLWKEPSKDSSVAVQKTLPGSGFRGAAFDGQN